MHGSVWVAGAVRYVWGAGVGAGLVWFGLVWWGTECAGCAPTPPAARRTRLRARGRVVWDCERTDCEHSCLRPRAHDEGDKSLNGLDIYRNRNDV